jgi:spore germination cell wall hydrolase CwlJ-like protein
MTQVLTLSRPLDGLSGNFARLKARGEALVRAYPRESVGFALLGLVAAAAIAGSARSTPEMPAQARVAPPAPPPLLLKPVTAEQALEVNQQIALAKGPNPAAQPFVFKGDANARAQALQCLASAVYYEAGNQDEDGERAVAQVVLNRVRHPAFPASVCGVVYEGSTRQTGAQFTFTDDGSLARTPDAAGWARARRIAEDALSGYVYAPVGYATHYHANYVLPVWASSMAKNAVVGAHIFYRWAGGWGQPAAFTHAYAGREPNAAALRSAALAVVHTAPIVTQSGEVAQAIKDIPGAEAIKLSPDLRGDKRVAVRFNLAARKASDEATHEDYNKKFETSNNLKYALSSEVVAADEKPFGKATEASGGSASAQK